MGCWNATCNISHLPIRHSERIVVIPLISTAFPKNTNTCYVSDNFQQMALPIRGEYNDYGGIENIEISPENEALIRSYEFYKLKDDNAELDKNDVENYVLVKQPNDIQECINNIMDAGEKYYVKYVGYIRLC